MLTPQKVIDKDQSYFWSEEWQAAERAAQADIDSGRVETFSNIDDLIRDLTS